LFKNVQADYNKSSHLLQKESGIYAGGAFLSSFEEFILEPFFIIQHISKLLNIT
jgi:hypothetical protein